MSPNAPRTVLAVDPGRDKCGLALVADSGECLRRATVASGELRVTVGEWVAETGASTLVIGDRTGSRRAAEELASVPGVEAVEPVDEHRSTEEARRLYFREQPVRGLRRLIPAGLRVPPGPIDDYAAWVLGRRYFAGLRDGRRG